MFKMVNLEKPELWNLGQVKYWNLRGSLGEIKELTAFLGKLPLDRINITVRETFPREIVTDGLEMRMFKESPTISSSSGRIGMRPVNANLNSVSTDCATCVFTNPHVYTILEVLKEYAMLVIYHNRSE